MHFGNFIANTDVITGSSPVLNDDSNLGKVVTFFSNGTSFNNFCAWLKLALKNGEVHYYECLPDFEQISQDLVTGSFTNLYSYHIIIQFTKRSS